MSKKKKDFIDKWVHDICTPLSVIQTFINLTSEMMRDEELQALCEAAISSFEKVQRLIDSLKDFDSQSEIKKSVCDIAELIRRVFVELGVLVDEKEIRLVYIGPDHLIGVADSLTLERVVQNLVKNAIQASGSKEDRYIEVRLLQKNETILIDVWDNGCGIAPKNLNKVFKKGITIGSHNGTGLGLAYCKETIEKHGGSINVHSQLGKGTLFSVILPMRVIAACNVTTSNSKILQDEEFNFLQIWPMDDEGKHVGSWVKRWQQEHKADVTKRVSYHRFMKGFEEDSIGMR